MGAQGHPLVQLLQGMAPHLQAAERNAVVGEASSSCVSGPDSHRHPARYPSLCAGGRVVGVTSEPGWAIRDSGGFSSGLYEFKTEAGVPVPSLSRILRWPRLPGRSCAAISVAARRSRLRTLSFQSGQNAARASSRRVPTAHEWGNHQHCGGGIVVRRVARRDCYGRGRGDGFALRTRGGGPIRTRPRGHPPPGFRFSAVAQSVLEISKRRSTPLTSRTRRTV